MIYSLSGLPAHMALSWDLITTLAGERPEILVDIDQVHLIRERETIDSLWALEHTVDD